MIIRCNTVCRLTLLLACIISGSSWGEEVTDSETGWHSIRGASFDGRVRGEKLADRWSADGPPVLWVRQLGQGYSSFVVHGDRLFTQMQTLAGQFVVCLDADTGKTVWEYRYDWPFEASGLYPGPRATPSYDDGRIYFAAPSGLIGALSADRGKLLWSVNLKEEFNGQGTDFGYSASPTVVDGKIFLPVGGKGAGVVALEGKSGAVIWKSGDSSASYTPLLPIQHQGRSLLIALLENTLAAHDLKSGEELWSIDLSQGYDEHAAWPIYSEPYLLICSPFRSGGVLYDLGNDASRRPTEIRRTNQMSNDIFSSVLVGDSLYGFDIKDVQAKLHRPSRGMFRCLEFPALQQRWETDSTGHATVLEADGKLILFNDKGELILSQANADQYLELGRAEVLSGEICWTQPTLHDGKIFIRNQTQAVCLYLGLPENLKRRSTEKTLRVSDIPQGTYFDLAKILGVEPEFAFDVPESDWLWAWYWLSLVAVLAPAAGISWVAGRLNPKSGSILRWWIYWLISMVLGAIGTTFLSLVRDVFTFTWPVCIFSGLQATVFHSRWGTKKLLRRPRMTSYLVGLLFFGLCLFYFLLCRRLSLVTEWVFLIGLPAGIPFVLLGARDSMKAGSSMRTILWTISAFSAYYWGCVLVLRMRYA